MKSDCRPSRTPRNAIRLPSGAMANEIPLTGMSSVTPGGKFRASLVTVRKGGGAAARHSMTASRTAAIVRNARHQDLPPASTVAGCRQWRARPPRLLSPLAHPDQLALQIAGRLPAVVRVLGEALAHDAIEAARRERLQVAHCRRLVLENRRDERGFGVRVERPPPRQHLVQQRAKREHIAACIHSLAAKLFGRHVRERAEHHPGARQRRVRPDAAAPCAIAPSGFRSCARPKSSSFTPVLVTMTLAGLRSRWTMPCPCAMTSASAMSIP